MKKNTAKKPKTVSMNEQAGRNAKPKSKEAKRKIGAAAKWIAPPADEVITIPRNHKQALRWFAGTIVGDIEDELARKLWTQLRNTPVAELGQRAQAGSTREIMALWSLAEETTSILAEIAERNPELLRPLARNLAVWPVLSGPHSKTKLRNAKLLERIGLGKSVDIVRQPEYLSQYSTPAKRWFWLLLSTIREIIAGAGLQQEIERQKANEGESPDSLSVFYAAFCFEKSGADVLQRWPFVELKLTKEIVKRCLSMKTFSADEGVVQSWWEVAHALLMLNTNGKPEAIQELGEIGESRGKHYSGMAQQKFHPRSSTPQPEPGYNSKSVEANIRSKILTDLREEFVLLAKRAGKISSQQ